MTHSRAVPAARRSDPLRPAGFSVCRTEILVSTLTISLLSLALPIMTLQIYDRILPNPGSGTLPVLVAGVCVAITLEALLRLGRAYMMAHAGARYEHLLSCQTMSHFIHSDISHLSGGGVGMQLHHMAAIGRLKDFYNGYALATLWELSLVPVFLAVIIYIGGPLAAIPALILMMFTLVSLAQGQNLRRTLAARDRLDDRRYDFLIESLEGIHTIKSLALEQHFMRRYEALEQDGSTESHKVTAAMAAMFNTGHVFSHIMIAAVIAAGALLVLQGAMTTGALIAAVLLSGRLMQPVQKGIALWARYQDYSLARQRVSTILERPRHTHLATGLAAGDDEAAVPDARLSDTLDKGRLLVDDLVFRAPDRDDALLDGVSLQVAPGDSVLLSAADDVALAVFLELITGIYTPDSGRILLDGRNIMDIPPDLVGRHIGYVRSQPVMFRGTIRDNLTCFGRVDSHDAREAASLLNLNRDIAGLPGGFDTMLSGDHGDAISPGFKQRIAMARILAMQPGLLIFDNADRALDREGYHMLYRILAGYKGKTSLILISEDRNIRGLAERRFHIADGRLQPFLAPVAPVATSEGT